MLKKYFLNNILRFLGVLMSIKRSVSLILNIDLIVVFLAFYPLFSVI